MLFFIPLLLSSAAIAITYKALLDPNFGLGAGLHLPFLAQDWLGDRRWRSSPWSSWSPGSSSRSTTLIYQGGVRQIPESMYEAAQIDGAGGSGSSSASRCRS